jgi:hypothetical protein
VVKLLVGYRLVEAAPGCPYCGERIYTLSDNGHATKLDIRCWCGANATVPRTDPDLAKWPGLPVAYLPEAGA